LRKPKFETKEENTKSEKCKKQNIKKTLKLKTRTHSLAPSRTHPLAPSLEKEGEIK